MTIKKPDNRVRAARLKAENREALRQKFKGAQHIAQIERGLRTLVDQSDLVHKAKNSKANQYKIQEVQSKADCINRLVKTQLDTHFRCLAKILPDIKQVELTDGDGNNPLGSLADALREAVSGSDT